jgi:hypothetical protein
MGRLLWSAHPILEAGAAFGLPLGCGGGAEEGGHVAARARTCLMTISCGGRAVDLTTANTATAGGGLRAGRPSGLRRVAQGPSDCGPPPPWPHRRCRARPRRALSCSARRPATAARRPSAGGACTPDSQAAGSGPPRRPAGRGATPARARRPGAPRCRCRCSRRAPAPRAAAQGGATAPAPARRVAVSTVVRTRWVGAAALSRATRARAGRDEIGAFWGVECVEWWKAGWSLRWRAGARGQCKGAGRGAARCRERPAALPRAQAPAQPPPARAALPPRPRAAAAARRRPEAPAKGARMSGTPPPLRPRCNSLTLPLTGGQRRRGGAPGAGAPAPWRLGAGEQASSIRGARGGRDRSLARPWSVEAGPLAPASLGRMVSPCGWAACPASPGYPRQFRNPGGGAAYGGPRGARGIARRRPSHGRGTRTHAACRSVTRAAPRC